MSAPPSTEAELLLLCLRPAPSHADRARVAELLRAGPDYERLLRLSLGHGVMPRVYRRLSTDFAPELPAGGLASFKEHFQANAARNLYLTGELLRLLEGFEREGVAAVPYKGPALGSLLDGDVTSQQFADLDIIVRPADYARAGRVLAARGYSPHFELDGEEEAAFMRLSYVQLFTRDEGRCSVELHWQVAPRFFARPLLDEGFWRRLRTIPLCGRPVLAPSDGDLLLILAVHGTKDSWERLKWVCGVAGLLERRADFDWRALVDAAAAKGLRRTLLLGLLLAHDLLGASLPEDVAREVRGERALAGLAGEVRARMFEPPPGLARRTLFHLRARERWRDRLRYCALFAVTTTPVDWASLRLPRRLAFLYYLVRPLRLVGKYVLKTPRRAH